MKLKEKYPKKTLEELDIIGRFPFKFVKEAINNDNFEMPTLINKFGTFSSTPDRRAKIKQIVVDKANAKESGYCESLSV